MDKLDILIIGAGPSGIFCAYELIQKRPDLNIRIIEKGRRIEDRICPQRKANVCFGCQPCSITTGFAGAGAFSDGKLSLSPDVGGNLPQILGYGPAEELIRESDEIYLKFGADTKVYGANKEKEIREIRRKAIIANLKLIECPIRHLGTEEGYKIYARLQEHLLKRGIQMDFLTMVKDILIEDGVAKGVVTDKGDTLYADAIVSAIGREGADWLSHVCKKHGIETQVGAVDIGVRVEVRDEVMEFINEHVYEAKLVYYTPTFDDKVRTFCSNPSGEVAVEYYDDGLAVVNGHAYKSHDKKTNNTNFAILVSKRFTKPFKTPIAYGKSIAELSNMLCDGKILVQCFGDFRRGRRTTEERLCRNNLVPTLKDAVPGDLSLVFPHRIMLDIEEMILALDKVTPGIASDETLLYGVEVKFYSNVVVVDQNFETNISRLYAIGDGASVTRGLQQASANGISVARSIINCMERQEERVNDFQSFTPEVCVCAADTNSICAKGSAEMGISMKGRREKLRLAGALLIIIGLFLSGCQNRDIVFSRRLTNNEVFRINNQICSLSEARVFLANYQNIYGRMQVGRDSMIDLWVTVPEESESEEGQSLRLEQYVKDMALSQLAHITSMSLLAKRENVSLTDSEDEAVQKAAEAYFASLNQEELEYTGASQETIEKMYKQYALANKLFHQLTADIREVSVDEARVMVAQVIYLSSEEKAREVEERLQAGADFSSLASTYNERGEANRSFGRNELPEAVDQVAFSLEDGEISGIIAAEDGYYLIKCIEKYNRELTDLNKQVLLAERKKAAFDNVYQAFVQTLSSDLNQRAWDREGIEGDEGITTRSFFMTLESYVYW